MYLAYLDDSDTKSKDIKWQVLTAVIIEDQFFKAVEMLMGVIGDNLLPPDKMQKFQEFHACELYGGYGVFEGISQSERFGAVKELLDLIKEDPLVIVYGAVDLSSLQNELYASADPLDIAFRICAKGAESWLSKNAREDFALFIADDGNAKSKAIMQRSFRQLRKPIRAMDYEGGELPHVHDDMYFGDSKYSIGIQLADLCSYFIARHLEGDVSIAGFYEMIEKKIVNSKIIPG